MDTPDRSPPGAGSIAGRPRGSTLQDGGLGCLSFIGFSMVGGGLLAVGMLFLPRFGVGPGALAAIDGSAHWIVSGIGVCGFVLAYRASERARARHAPVLRQVLPVLILWAFIAALVVLSLAT